MDRHNAHTRSRSKPVTIDSVVGSVVASLGLKGSFEGCKVVTAWPEIVGPDVAERAVAERVADGILYVRVEKDVWRQQLQMQKEAILKMIHRLPYGRSITEIRLVGGKKGYHSDGLRND
ncbi:DUF721 domain-containing protein [candidate division GN15 bacterium]|nr:DUF721 domain-containing protein [candidate division GN15 bacterium]